MTPSAPTPVPVPAPAPASSVLVINSGSSSIKYQLVDPAGGEALAIGLVERIGEPVGRISHSHGGERVERELPVPDHGEGLRLALSLFAEAGPDLGAAGVAAVGHRVVHGGSLFSGPTVIDDAVVRDIRDLAQLAPLHNPAHAVGIEVARALLPDVPHVAVFDTAFFRTLPEAAHTYALDREVAARHGIRRYGFHGTSHQYVSEQVADVLDRPLEGLRQIVLHLGNGASASAVDRGVAVDTSMGLTPLEGLVMGTRTGDIDPAVIAHLYRTAGMGIEEIDDLLNRRSGIKGLSGVNDFRALWDLVDAGDAGARLAVEVYVHRVRKYIGAYVAVLGGLDAVTFTAGVGENDDRIRAAVLGGLGHLGIVLDADRNAGRKKAATVISADGSPVTALVVPTNEELAIARQSLAVADAAR